MHVVNLDYDGRVSATRLLVLGAIRTMQPVHGYRIRRELLSWCIEETTNVKPGSIYGAIRTLVAIVHDVTSSPAEFRAWSLGVFISLLAFDAVRILIWLDHMGLRVATLVNLSFLGMDRVDRRLARAVAKRSRTGSAAIEQSWITYEYGTMQALHRAGARVPEPFAMSGHALLMEYLGDADGPAPKLKHVSLSAAEARTVYEGLIDEIGVWLAHDRIHGDLSPFNVLYWKGQAIVIDFPQAVNPWDNPDSRFLLERDIRNVTTHFAAYGIVADPARIARDLWERFMRGTLQAN